MYGTIFEIKVKDGHEQALIELMSDSDEIPEGMIAWFLMKPDDGSDLVGVAVFESQEAHVKNANDPATNESFIKMMEHCESEPTWKDGTYIAGEVAS